MEQELGAASRGTALIYVIGDVTSGARVREILELHRPSVVFHAAAYKYVPLMEERNAWQAVANNTLGTCLGGQRPASVAVCGNDPNGPTPELNKITLTFNKAVKLLSAAGETRSVVGDTMGDNIISSVWTTAGSFASFIATNSDNTMTPGDVTLNPFNFMFSNFIAQANIPVTVETSFTQGKLDYWVQNLKVEAAHVPGPLPLLGVGTAFAYSRRIRRRCKAASRIELV
jgi:hypothetical protein